MSRSSTSIRAADGDSIAAAILHALGQDDREVRGRGIVDAAERVDPELLLEAVADPADAVRRNAAMDALVRGGRRSVPTLVRALDDDDDELVMFSAGLLGRTRDRAAIPHLLRLLGHKDVNVVQTAIEALGYLRARDAVEPLIGLLEREPWVRLGAIHALGEIGDPRAVEPLATTLADGESWAMAVAALGKLRSLRAIAYLSEALEVVSAEDFTVPLLALGDALRRNPDPESLSELEPWTRLGGRKAKNVHGHLAEVLDEVAAATVYGDTVAIAEAVAIVVRTLRLEPLYLPLLRGARNPTARPSVQLWMLAIGGAAASAIAECLRDPSPEVRALACRCAGVLRLQTVADRLLGALADPHDGVRSEAAYALAKLGAPRAAAAVAALLLDPSPAVTAAARHALAAFEPAVASSALLALPRDRHGVVAAMLRAMRAQPHTDQLPFLLDNLRQDSAELRQLAIEALAEQSELDVVTLLEPCLDDGASDVRAAAVHAVARQRTARTRALLLDHIGHDGAAVAQVVDALIAMDGRTVASRLIELSRGLNGPARAAIALALAGLDEPAAEPLVVDLLGHRDAELRAIGVRAAARMSSPAMRRHLTIAATDPAWTVRASVAEALATVALVVGDQNGTDVAAELERLSLDDHAQVARTARHALERASGG